MIKLIQYTDHDLDDCAMFHAECSRQYQECAHNWSGWPGAVCLICGVEDVREMCLANPCRCICHNEFWAAYNGQAGAEAEHDNQD